MFEMSDNEGNSRKMSKSVQERVQEYRKNNPEQNKLSRERAKLAKLKRKVEDPEYAEEEKKKERLRKAEQRKQKKMQAENEEKEKENSFQLNSSSEDSISEATKKNKPTPKSHQALSGLLVRRQTNKEKNEAIDNLKQNNKIWKMRMT